MLVEFFKPENFPFFPQSISRNFFPAFARDPRKNSRVTSSNMQGELWLITNSWRHGIFFSARFRRQIFSAAETKVEKTECSRSQVVCRIRIHIAESQSICNVIFDVTISCRSFVFGQSRAKVSNGFTNANGLAVAAFDLVYYSLSVLRFVFVLDIT